MADINHVITLGIGTPGGIKHFILLGLSPSVSEPTVSVFDTVTVSEETALLLTRLASLSDTVTVSENVADLLLSHFVATSETVTVTEALSVTQVFTSSSVDTITVSESISNLLAMFATTSDTVTVAEALTNTLTVNAVTSDTVTVSETAAVTFIIDVSVFDTVTISEAASFATSIGFTVIDTVMLSDALTEPLTWTIRIGATPIEGVKVWLSFADPYTAANLVRDSIKHTDAAGQVSYDIEFNLTMYGWRDHQSITFPDPWVFRFSTTNGRWETYSGGVWSAWTP